jgi:hypothetical protein
MVSGQLLFHLLPQRVLKRGGKRLFPRLLVLRNPIRKEVLKVPRSLGLVNRLLPPCMLLTPPFCSSGRETYPVSTSLGEVHHRCVGFVSNSRGIGSCVSGTPSFVGQSDSYVSDLRQGEVPSSVRGSSISITEKSNRGNSSDSVDTRVLFSSLLGSQAELLLV